MSQNRHAPFLRRAAALLVSSIAQPFSRPWHNPLLVRERRIKPLPSYLSWTTYSILSGGLAVVPIFSWAVSSRLLGAAVLGIGLAAALIPMLAVPYVSAGIALTARGDGEFATLSSFDKALGCALVALWRLRWPIGIGLALTPALMISLVRLDVATFSAYRDSVLALGAAAPSDQSRLLLSGGGIPYFRLVIRAISGGLMPWAILLVSASLGVSGSLILDDLTFGQLAALLATMIVILAAASLWDWLSLTPILAGGFEVVRLLLLMGMLAGLARLAGWMAHINARLLPTRQVLS